MKKAKKTTIRRKSIKERIFDAEQYGIKKGHDVAWSDAAASVRREFLPPYEAREGILSFVRTVESWPIDGKAVVVVVATDLKHICNAALPAKVLQVIAAEMKKRLA